jgi:serine/threonine protein kinase
MTRDLKQYCIKKDINSKYNIHSELGRGSTSKVYLGISTTKNKQVAIKVIKKSRLSANERRIDNFINEISIHWSLRNCKHII